jgi:hypothetical protein
MDTYYRQVFAWSQQQAQQQAQERANQQRIDEARINAERERLRQEHLERTRIYEAQLFNTAASSVGSGGGSLSNPSVNEFIADDYIDDYFE